MSRGPGKWTPAVATRRINECAKDVSMSLSLAEHVKDRLAERDLLMGDLLHLLRTGFVFDEPEPSTREDHFKYRVEGKTPNSDSRFLRAAVIPSDGCAMKVVTIMWRDER